MATFPQDGDRDDRRWQEREAARAAGTLPPPRPWTPDPEAHRKQVEDLQRMLLARRRRKS